MLRYYRHVWSSVAQTSSFPQLKESWEYDTAEERKTDAEQFKEKGNAFFKVSKEWMSSKSEGIICFKWSNGACRQLSYQLLFKLKEISLKIVILFYV